MKTKKMAIAIGAVSAYIKSEEEQMAGLLNLSRPKPEVNKPWAVAGRLSMMQLADLIQMKAFNIK